MMKTRELVSELPDDMYECYLTRQQCERLAEADLSDNTSLRLAVHGCRVVEDGERCVIFPDLRAMVRICRELGEIPDYHHSRLADALRDDGWTAAGPEGA